MSKNELSLVKNENVYSKSDIASLDKRRIVDETGKVDDMRILDHQNVKNLMKM